jgi:hypothetical protein
VEQRLRLDLLIAVFAVLLSAVASFASVYQAHVITQEFSATVWPYLTITINSSPATIQTSVTNDGLGPAIIRSASLVWDRTKNFASWRDMAVMLVKLSPHPKRLTGLSISGTSSSLDPGDVIRAGDSRSLFSLRGWNGFPATLEQNAIGHGLTVSICYCSLLGRCWIKTWEAQLPSSIAREDIEPYEVRRCPPPHGISG